MIGHNLQLPRNPDGSYAYDDNINILTYPVVFNNKTFLVAKTTLSMKELIKLEDAMLVLESGLLCRSLVQSISGQQNREHEMNQAAGPNWLTAMCSIAIQAGWRLKSLSSKSGAQGSVLACVRGRGEAVRNFRSMGVCWLI